MSNYKITNKKINAISKGILFIKDISIEENVQEIVDVVIEQFGKSEDSDYMTGQTLMVDGGSIKLR